MSCPKLIRQSFGLFFLALAVVASALGQEFTIHHADYGFEEQRVDVTERLRELARTNSTFRMDNRTFGVDPAPGVVKTLRIFARGPNGQMQTFEYREGSYIDGAKFAGWGNGDWGRIDKYQILSAHYGTPDRNIDVTQTLRELARTDTFFRMGNRTFHDDPAPGVPKTLRIWARGPDGQPRMFEYREGSVVDGNIFSGWGSGNWNPAADWHGGWNGAAERMEERRGELNIIRAMYGVEGRRQDVTGRVQSLIREGRLNIVVDYRSMDADPAPHMAKDLRIKYSVGRGPEQEANIPDGGQLSIP